MLGPASTFDFHVEDRATREGVLSVGGAAGKLMSQEELGSPPATCSGGNGDGSPHAQDCLVGLWLGRDTARQCCPRVGGLLFSVLRAEPLSEHPL